MQNTIKFTIKTLSNLFIGGAPIPFEIGGIDQQTAIDQEGFPYIPGSSLKGTLRAIVHEDNSEMKSSVSQLYSAYLNKEREDNRKYIKGLVDEEEAWERIIKKYNDADKKLSSEYLFGIEGFNNTPKLIFSDLLLCNEFRDIKACFSIDMKNTIDTSGDVPVSNPRTYKTARRGLVFNGEIRLYRVEQLGTNAKELCESYVIYNLLKFNNGVYRLGNSKSRGYGKVEVNITKGSGALEI